MRLEWNSSGLAFHTVANVIDDFIGFPEKSPVFQRNVEILVVERDGAAAQHQQAGHLVFTKERVDGFGIGIVRYVDSPMVLRVAAQCFFNGDLHVQ